MTATLTTFQKNSFIMAMIMSFSMIFLNESGAIGVAFPQMQLSLSLSNNTVHWIMNAFLLTASLLLLLGGKLADHYGCRKIFIIGLVLFAAASILCACAQHGQAMIIGRILQAIGASLVYPSGGALLSLHFSKTDFAKVYGTVLGFAYLFVAFGPFIGGLFTDFLTWRWLFWINIVFSSICLCLTLYAIPKDTIAVGPLHLDLKGWLAFIIGLGALVVALMQGAAWGWSSAVILGLFVLAAIASACFIFIEAAAQNPLLPVRLFVNKSFMAGNVIFACVAACFTALIFWAMWLQQVCQFSPVSAGIALIPATVSSIFMLRISGAWGGRVGPRKPMLVGAGLLVVSLLWIAISAQAQSYPWLFWGLLGFGFATPLLIPNSIGVIMNSVEPSLRGSVAGVYLTLQHIAFSLGFALLSAIIASVDNHHLYHLLSSTPLYAGVTAQQAQVLLLGKTIVLPLNVAQMISLKQTVTLIYSHAFSCAMLALSGLSILVLGLTWRFIPKNT